MMGLIRKVKDKTYSPIEVKVRDATSNDKWGAPLSLQREISSYTHDPAEYPKLFAMLWKRLTDHEHLTHVQKALILLHYLLRHGSARFVEDAMARKNDVARLQKYKHYTGDKEDAAEARQLAKQTFALLNDPAVLSAARKAAAGEKKTAVPIDDEELPDEVERAAEKKRAAAMAKIPSKKATVPETVEDDGEGDQEAEEGDDDDEEAKRAALEIQAALAATEITPTARPPAAAPPQPVYHQHQPVAAKKADVDFFASLGDPWAPATAAPPASHDPWEALATRQQPAAAPVPVAAAPPPAAHHHTAALALDPFAPIPSRPATQPAGAPAAASRPAPAVSAGFLDGTEW